MKPWIFRAMAMVILAAMAGQQYILARKPVATEAYQSRIGDLALAAPLRIGSWVGQDVPVPLQAMNKLKPNMMISRQFTNVADGLSVGFLLEHCADAHDMAGHFPPHCFPANGWTMRSAIARDWLVGDLSITGMEYAFTMSDPDTGREKSEVVINCLLRPGKIILRDMDMLARSALMSGGDAAGSGQLQLYFDASTPAAQRDAAAEELIRGHLAVIDAILSNP